MTDRRTIKREYKEADRPMGVFRVLNRENGKALIGSSRNLRASLNRHRAELQMGSHRNRLLQEEWQEFGSDAFEFETLEVLEPQDTPGYDPSSDLKVQEELWLEKLAPYGEHGFHQKPDSSA